MVHKHVQCESIYVSLGYFTPMSFLKATTLFKGQGPITPINMMSYPSLIPKCHIYESMTMELSFSIVT
jgi:hypothetical protein